MATWWTLTFEGEPTEEDFAHVAAVVAQGFTSGQLINEPGAELEEGPATGIWAPGDPEYRIKEILGELNGYEVAHSDSGTEGSYDIWDDLIVWLPEYEVDTTEAADGGSHMHFVALGTVFSYSHETGGWITEPYVREG